VSIAGRRILAPALLGCAIVLFTLRPPASAAESAPAPSLASIAWHGPSTDLSALQGKTVVVLTYVTWCPICNKWAPELLSQLNKAVQDKPVVVLAVSTDVGPEQGHEFLAGMKFAGPNILYGADPNLETALGLDKKQLWSFVVIDPSGQVTNKGAAGMYQGGEANKQYVVAANVASSNSLGSFELITPEMSADLKQILWPMELGQMVAGQQNLKKAEKLIGPADRDLLRGAVGKYNQTQIENVRKLSTGEVPDKLAALDKAGVLATNFKATEIGNEAKKIVAELTKDKTLKKELAAKKAYEQSLLVPDADRKTAKLQATAKLFPDTYYGQQASKAAAAVVK
jgi:peroxiredoxin